MRLDRWIGYPILQAIHVCLLSYEVPTARGPLGAQGPRSLPAEQTRLPEKNGFIRKLEVQVGVAVTCEARGAFCSESIRLCFCLQVHGPEHVIGDLQENHRIVVKGAKASGTAGIRAGLDTI